MPRRRKVKVSSVLQMMPHLFKLTRAKSRRQREELLKNFDTPQKDVLTRLLEVALDNIPQESLTPAQLKAINSSGEQLRFLKFYSKCKKRDRKKMRPELQKNLKQCGRGVGAILGIALPILIEVIRAAIPSKTSPSSSSSNQN